MDGQIDTDELWIALGPWGRFQCTQIALVLLTIINLAFHLLSTVFIAYRPPFQCNETTVGATFTEDINRTHANISYSFVYNKCTIDVYKANSTLLKTTECVSGYSYPVPKDRTLDTEEFESFESNTEIDLLIKIKDNNDTLSYNWDLVCDRAELAELSQTLVILGQACGSAIFTSLADKFGRKKVHIFGHISLFATSFAIAWSPNYTVFAVLRFILGAVHQGSGLTMNIICLEILPLKVRYLAEIMGQTFWTTGIVLLSAFGYLFRDFSWRYLQMALALMACYSLIEYWLLDESVRWLLANGKTKQAEKIIRKAAKMNGKNFNDVIQAATIQTFVNQNGAEKKLSTIAGNKDNVSKDKEQVVAPVPIKRYNVITIFRHKIILINSLILWFTWFVDCLVYYAISLTTSALSGNRFVNFFLIAIVEYPAVFLEYLLLNRIGRRKTCILFHVIAGTALTVSTICMTVSGGVGAIGVISLVFNLVGKFGITGSYSSIFLYTPELYPTNLRNAGFGITGSISKIGGMLAPFAGPLMDYIRWGPGAISAALCLIAVYLLRFLPETKGYELPTTIEELKTWYKDHAGDKKVKPIEEENESL